MKYLRIRSAIMSWILCFLSYSVLSMSSQTIARVSAPSIEGWGVESWCLRSVAEEGGCQSQDNGLVGAEWQVLTDRRSLPL